MKNIILTLLYFFGAVSLFFIALLYAQMDVGIKNIHYDYKSNNTNSVYLLLERNLPGVVL